MSLRSKTNIIDIIDDSADILLSYVLIEKLDQRKGGCEETPASSSGQIRGLLRTFDSCSKQCRLPQASFACHPVSLPRFILKIQTLIVTAKEKPLVVVVVGWIWLFQGITIKGCKLLGTGVTPNRINPIYPLKIEERKAE